MTVSRSAEKARHLTASDLGIAPPDPEVYVSTTSVVGDGQPPAPPTPPDEPKLKLKSELDTNNSQYQQVIGLLSDGYAGVIFAGPPGTSKTWYAHQIAILLADGEPERLRALQFHASYQYEDFVQGYVPRRDGSGFRLRSKHLLEMCRVAEQLSSDKTCVIVIDELSRADPGRVFGDCLTYVEMSRRGQKFRLASGRELSIPPNLVFLATMNTFDRGVDEIDIAFERRFARVEMPPDPDILSKMLAENQMSDELRARVQKFFGLLQKHPIEQCQVGHAYFRLARTEDDLSRLWNHQLRFTLEKACRLQADTFKRIEQWWREVVPPQQQQAQTPQEGGGNGAAGGTANA